MPAKLRATVLCALACGACGLLRPPLAPRRALAAPARGGGPARACDRGPAPFSQAQVPAEQQPANELRELRREPFFDWAELPPAEYLQRMGGLFAFFALAVSLPVALQTYGDLPRQLPQVLLASAAGGSGATLAFALRLRTGWGYVSNRLRDRTTYYEASGQKGGGRGGFVVEKDGEAAMRDQLLEQYEVQPALRRSSSTAAGLALALVASLALLRAVAPSEEPYEQYTPQYLSRLGGDDALAASEQRRAQQAPRGAKPAYCDSRYYKALGSNDAGLCD